MQLTPCKAEVIKKTYEALYVQKFVDTCSSNDVFFVLFCFFLIKDFNKEFACFFVGFDCIQPEEHKWGQVLMMDV